jgi:hypothetical protein
MIADRNRLNGFTSDIAYTGFGNRYLLLIGNDKVFVARHRTGR